MGNAGLSEARLDRMRETMAGHVARGTVPGMLTVVARGGKARAEAIGETTFDGGGSMRRDAIRPTSTSGASVRSRWRTSRGRGGSTTPAPTCSGS